MSNEFRKQALDRIKYSVRASQAILQYGVGAMVDFQEQTLMTAAPATWNNAAPIHDERLEKILDVTHFKGFNIDFENPTVSYVRFPRWYFCPKCRTFCDLDDWKRENDIRASKAQKDNDPDMVKKLWCPSCHVPLVVSRIVSICQNGHIDDFPWIKWVHAKSKPSRKNCGNTILKLTTSNGTSSGLEGISVKCSCGAFATLKGAFSNTKNPFEDIDDKTNDEYGFKCSGFHPWKNTFEKCNCYPKAAQRGSSSVYFPYIISSLVIPPYSSRITNLIENSCHYDTFRTRVSDIITDGKDYDEPPQKTKEKIERAIDKFSEKIANEIGIDHNEIRRILERKQTNTISSDEGTDKQYRYEEYTALNGEIRVSDDTEGDFVREETKISDYNLPYVKRISLIHKIREVRVLKGFTRCEPVDRSLNSRDSERIVDIKPSDENWYPAYEVRGEGIFIEFDNEEIKNWIKRYPIVLTRADDLNDKFKLSFFGQNSNKRISAKFVLLHTVAHLLIKEMSFSCGYNIASLQERIYCAEKNIDGMDMEGIFIYTAGGDSEGTLGGLVRQGRYDVFPGIFKKAIESAVLCSNDPVCCLSHGQGRDSLNLAACHTCCLIPETSCEESNVFLDRAMIVGNFDHREIGFYSSMVNCDKKWEYAFSMQIEPESEQKLEKKLFITNEGRRLNDCSYIEIFRDLMADASDIEKINIKKIIAADRFGDLTEKPFEGVEFTLSGSEEQYSGELMWKKAGVIYFSDADETDYIAAKASDWKCFFGGSAEFDPDEFIKAVMEE